MEWRKSDRFRLAAVERGARRSEQIVENGDCVDAGNAVDGVEVEAEIGAFEESGDLGEVEHLLEKSDVVFGRGDDIDLEGMIFDRKGATAALVDGDGRQFRHPQLLDLQGLGENGVGDVLCRCCTVLAIESRSEERRREALHTEICVDATRIVTGCQDKTSVGNTVLTSTEGERNKEKIPDYCRD